MGGKPTAIFSGPIPVLAQCEQFYITVNVFELMLHETPCPKEEDLKSQQPLL